MADEDSTLSAGDLSWEGEIMSEEGDGHDAMELNPIAQVARMSEKITLEEDGQPKFTKQLTATSRPSAIWHQNYEQVSSHYLFATQKTTDELYPGEKKYQMENGLTSTGLPVDCVLVYELPTTDPDELQKYQDLIDTPIEDDDPEHVKDMKERAYFEDGLTKATLMQLIAKNEKILEDAGDDGESFDALRETLAEQKRFLEFSRIDVEHELGPDGRTVYVKLHFPFKTLCRQAEHDGLVMPLAPLPEFDNVKKSRKSIFLIQMSRFRFAMKSLYQRIFESQTDLPEDEDFVSGKFRYSRLALYRNGANEADHDKFFTPSQRSYLVSRILDGIRYERLNDDHSNSYKTGISRLVKKKTYTACFSLHDGHYKSSDPEKSTRTLLFQTWARWRNCFKPQPIERVRFYFGEKIAFYFLWLGFYTQALLLPALVGLIVFIVGFATYGDQTDAEELCNSNLQMCGICATCDKWPLNEACDTYKFGYIFDNGGTVFFAFFMSCWATMFLEFWKRRSITAAYDWDVLQVDETEPQRPQFDGVEERRHPITDHIIQYFPRSIRARRYIASALSVIFMLALVLWSVLGIIIFRIAIRSYIYENSSGQIQAASGAITSVLAALLSLISIIFWGYIYKKVAVLLTEYENHERQSDYERHLTLKMFCFQFVNYYSSIFYIAFFKGKFVGTPDDHGTFLGFRNDDCPEYGCMLELTIQLSVIMVGKQFIGNVKELLIPAVITRVNKYFFKKAIKESDADVRKGNEMTPWGQQRHLREFPVMGLFPEYLEMVIQFGFVTLFVSAFPLAPVFALFNNMAEIRIDAKKLLRDHRRPFAMRAEDIGIWKKILTIVSILAVVTNAFVIALTSSFIPKIVYMERNSGSLVGYIQSQYAYSPVSPDASPNDEDCYYQSYRDSNGEFTDLYYEVMMGRLAFVIVFEHLVFVVKFLMSYITPDIPKDVKRAMQREKYKAREAFEEAIYGKAAIVRDQKDAFGSA